MWIVWKNVILSKKLLVSKYIQVKYYLNNVINIMVVFTARRICIARTMPPQDVCLSAHPSVIILQYDVFIDNL